jgi:hypothetical protein
MDDIEDPETLLDNDLVARIIDNLKTESSEQLREILAQSTADKWSPEAVKAARLLLAQRANNEAPEPVYRTVPRQEQGYEDWQTGDSILAPGYSGLFLTGTLSPGKVGEIRGESAYIYFYNGERGWVPLQDVLPLTIDVGSRVYCLWRGKTGTIVRWDDDQDRFYVRYDDGEGYWAPLAGVATREIWAGEPPTAATVFELYAE